MDNRRRIATLFDSNRNDDGQDRQAFYAGGSERSGQQILGPPNEPNSTQGLVDNVFSEAQRIAVSAAESGQRASDAAASLPIRFWSNGFTIGDGDLRPYTTPENQQFLDHLKRGETPPELVKLMREGMVDVKLESRRHEEFRERPVERVVAFSGEGHRLGNPTPETVGETSASTSTVAVKETNAPPQVVGVDESQPLTSVQIRFPDNSRLVARVNLTHRVGDLVEFVRSANEEFCEAPFVLATTFPARELSDLGQTIEDAKLQNSCLVVKRKR